MSALNWSRWPNFGRHEFVCHCGCDHADMDAEFMDRLQDLRTSLDFPLVISSGFRCPEHNARVSDTGGTGPHTTGCAADVRIYGRRARELLAIADQFSGIGIKQHGPHASRFIHLDSLVGPGRPALWSYR